MFFKFLNFGFSGLISVNRSTRRNSNLRAFSTCRYNDHFPNVGNSVLTTTKKKKKKKSFPIGTWPQLVSFPRFSTFYNQKNTENSLISKE